MNIRTRIRDLCRLQTSQLQAVMGYIELKELDKAMQACRALNDSVQLMCDLLGPVTDELKQIDL